MNKVYLYSAFNRFWHWTQAFLIITLVVTGFEVRGYYDLLGFKNAIHAHNGAALLFLLLIPFAIFWHFVTGQWKQYLPTHKNLFAMVLYYSRDIFFGKDHPVHKSEDAKLNPLQRLAYLSIKVFLIPMQVLTGLLYYFYNDIPFLHGKLELIAISHVVVAFLFIGFTIGHIYLTTTGHTLTSNIKAMVTGYEDLDH